MPNTICSRRMLAMPLCLTALWCLVVYALFLWVARSEGYHVRELALSQARTLFTQLVSTRAWNAMYGGVFVLEDERNRPNLDLPENRRAVETSEGLRLIRVNPAYMTRQIAEIVNSQQGVTFHITSLDPVRAANAPDAWEREALQAFLQGEKEVFALCGGDGELDGEHRFRYMAPLHVDTTCWDCHYVEPRGILRPDRPQDAYELKEIGVKGEGGAVQDAQSVLVQDSRSPLALMQVPEGETLTALAEACPEVEPSVDGVVIKVGAIPTLRGGISVSMAAGPLLAVEAERVRVLALAYGGIGLLGIIGIGGASFIMSRRQAVAEAANRTKGTFLANMSHDMRTPLAGMLGMVELMQGGKCEENKRLEYLNMLQDSAHSLLEIVNDITDFSRLEAGKMGLCPRTFIVRDEVATVVDLFRFTCEQKGLALQVHVDTNVPERLVGDAFRLRQALGNLLANAVKFTAQGRIDVTVHVLEWHEQVVVHFGVRDTGCGIAESEHERIFDSFEQSVASRQTRSVHSGGSGLGLAIVREIATLFGGQAGVESSLGYGSFFWFTACLELAKVDTGRADDAQVLSACPHAESAHREHQTQLEERSLPKKAMSQHVDFTILVADDNPVVRLFFHETLVQAGYTVLLAEHGEAALEMLRQRGLSRVQDGALCHMALLDVRMPKLSGAELLARIRHGDVHGVAADMPVYMVTASALCDVEELRGTVVADGVVLKPLQATALLELVDGVYAAWRQKEPCSLDKDSGDVALQKEGEDMMKAEQYPWDTSAALQGLGNNEALLQALLRAFIPEGTARRERIVAALARPHEDGVRALREEAHALANSAGVLCCGDLLNNSKLLEKMAVDLLEHGLSGDLVKESEIRAVMVQATSMLSALDVVLEALLILEAGQTGE